MQYVLRLDYHLLSSPEFVSDALINGPLAFPTMARKQSGLHHAIVTLERRHACSLSVTRRKARVTS